MRRLYFSDRHARLVEVLYRAQIDGEKIEGLNPSFKQLTDLMLFSAMIGKYHNRLADLEGHGGGELQSSAFRYNEDGVVYLLGLHEVGDPSVFKGDADGCWDLLQRYSAGGMDQISEWLKGNNPEDYQGELLEKLGEVARSSKKVVQVKVKRPKKRLI